MKKLAATLLVASAPSLCVLLSACAQNGTPPADLSSTAAVPPQPLKGLNIALDIGHTKTAPGAISARGRGEFFFNHDIVRQLAPALEKAGAEVHVINPKGFPIGLQDRTRIAKEEEADLFLSIHHDSVNKKYKKSWTVAGKNQEYSDKFKGFSVFFSNKNPLPSASKAMATRIGSAMQSAGFTATLHHAEKIQGENRPLINKEIGLYEFTDLIVLKTATMPAVLLECGVIVHRAEEEELMKGEVQAKIVNAVVSGLTAFALSDQAAINRP